MEFLLNCRFQMKDSVDSERKHKEAWDILYTFFDVLRALYIRPW